MKPSDVGKRLTWDAAYPAPYESIWSVIAKVVVLNNLTLSRLILLIKRKDLEKCPVLALDCSETDWIDFDAFSSLLGVGAQRLKQGTWRGLGMSPQFRKRYAMRHCLECWKSGYHCVFFDLIAVASCPWHGCKLTEHCHGCTKASTFTIRTSTCLINQRFCEDCRRVLPDREQIIATNKRQSIAPAILESSCGLLMNWLLETQFADRRKLLSELLWVGDGARQLARYQNLQLGHAVQTVGTLDPLWTFSVTPEPVYCTALSVTLAFGNPGEPPPRITDVEGRCYRSLRRHLYNTYIRQHKKCYRQLKELSREESLLLNGEMLCRPCLAFLIWRMSIEGVTQIDGLRFRRKDNFSLRLMGPPDYRELPFELSLRWSYYAFFGIRQQLESWRRASIEGFKVVMGDGKYPGDIFWKYICDACKQDADGDLTIDARFAILYPDVGGYNETEQADCRTRRLRSENMTTGDYSGYRVGYERPHSDISIRHVLFQATFPSRARTSYEAAYLTV